MFPERLSINIVFGNPYIVENILSHFEKKAFLNLRRVNKLFNETCLGMIRRKNRTIKIEFLQSVREVATLGKDSVVHVNGQPMKLAKLFFYFCFLMKLAKLKLERLIVVDVWKLSLSKGNQKIAEQFHRIVIFGLIGKNRKYLKELTGFYEACQLCRLCRMLSIQCETFGPMSHIVPNNEKSHFKKFVIKDGALVSLANACLKKSNSMERCFKMLETKIIDTYMTCSTLVLQISEARGRNGSKSGCTPIPREVFQMILAKWEVKNIEIKFAGTAKDYGRGEWSENGYFTWFKFNDMFGSVKKLEHIPKFEHIHVDLSRSLYCARAFKRLEHSGYENMIANVRRAFNPNRISITFSHWFYLPRGNLSAILENFLRVSRMDAHRNLTIDIRFYTKLRHDVKIVNGEIDFEIPKPYEIIGPKITRYHKSLKDGSFKTEKWIGERCRFVDVDQNFTLNVDVFVTEEGVEKAEVDQNNMLIEMFQLDSIGN